MKLSNVRTERRIPQPPPVLSKADFTTRYYNGEFGNASPTWQTLEEFTRAGRAKFELVHIRNRTIGGATYYGTYAHQVADKVWELVNEDGWSKEDFYYSLMAPTHLTTLQGELYNGALYYSTVPKPMRDSLIEGGKQVGRVVAKVLIERFMNQRSQNWLHWLQWAYPEHVIEFSCYSRCWGTVPGHNTVFWEIRKY